MEEQQEQMELPEILLEIHPQQMREWLDNPTTRKVQKFWKECQQSLETQMSQGTTLSLTSLEEVALQTNYLLGQIQGCSLILMTLQESKDYINQKEEEA